MIPAPLVHDLVFIGGGHSHALVLRNFAMNPLPGVRITLISPTAHTPYSGMLPGHIAGHYTFDEIHIDLVRLAEAVGARFIEAEATGIDRSAQEVQLSTGRRVPYDTLSINIGSTSEVRGLPGAAEHLVPIKPLSGFLEAWNGLLDTARRDDRLEAPIAVIGGGVGGIESAMAMAYRLRQSGIATLPSPLVRVFERQERILPTLAEGVRQRILAAMKGLGVVAKTGAAITRVAPDHFEIEGTADGAADANRFSLAISAAGANAPNWLQSTGLELTERGFVRVGTTLQATTDPNIFSAGDISHMDHAPREKAGVFAVRQGKPLAENLRRRIKGEKLAGFEPQSDYLKLISKGGKTAIGIKFGAVLEGGWLWRWKDRIDRQFMDQFTALHGQTMGAGGAGGTGSKGKAEPMASDRKPDVGALTAAGVSREAMLCQGCGAKVGPQVLSAALAGRLDAHDDAALITVPEGKQLAISHDHLRAFTRDETLMARIATVHATSDVFAMGATPHAALLAVSMAHMTPLLQARTMTAILDGVMGEFQQLGFALVGGHTSQAGELTIGLTVIGAVTPGAVFTTQGALPGDQLVLTKPIGTGTMLAAGMRGLADGRHTMACYDVMLQDNRAAADIFSAPHLRNQVRAVTDVTGFGLAGHVLRMIDGDGPARRIRLELEGIPILDGVADYVDKGVRSSLYEDNARAVSRLAFTDEGVHSLTQNPRFILLADPQTSGGLLASVAPEAADDLVNRLQEAGYRQACVIGAVEEA